MSAKKPIHHSEFKKLREIIIDKPDTPALELAKAIGLSGIQDLYDFIQKYKGCSIREYKHKVLNEGSRS